MMTFVAPQDRDRIMFILKIHQTRSEILSVIWPLPGSILSASGARGEVLSKVFNIEDSKVYDQLMVPAENERFNEWKRVLGWLFTELGGLTRAPRRPMTTVTSSIVMLVSGG